MPKRSRSGAESEPARVVAPISVNLGRSSRMLRADGPLPVSYTHLDVYKRQLLIVVRMGKSITLFCRVDSGGRLLRFASASHIWQGLSAL